MRIDIEQRLKRDKDISVVKLEYGTIETLDGQVLRLDTRTLAGDAKDIRAHGDVIGGEMMLILDGSGEQTRAGDPLEPRGSRSLRSGTEHGQEAHERKRATGSEDVHCRAEQDLRHHSDRCVESSRSSWATARRGRSSASSRRPRSTASPGPSSTSRCGSIPPVRS